LFAATIRGSKFISTINSIMTVILIISIFIFIVFGVSKVQSGYFSEGNFFRNGFSGFISAIAIMGWACQGTTMGPVAVSAVTKKSKKNIPLGILLVTVLLAVVYFAMSYVAAGVLPIEEVSNKNLSLVAKEIFPYWIFVIFIIGGAVFAIATSMITAITMVRYPILKVAEDGWLPKICKKTTSSGYPWVVYLIFYIVSIVSVLTEALVWVIQLNFSRKFIKDVSILPAMSKIILASVVMYLGLFVFKTFVQFKPMINVAVDGLIGAIIYVILIFVLRVVDMKDLKHQLMKN